MLHTCVLCGAHIFDGEIGLAEPLTDERFRWLGECRMLYSHRPEWESPNLSGVGSTVGIVTLNDLALPRSQQSRYDDNPPPAKEDCLQEPKPRASWPNSGGPNAVNNSDESTSFDLKAWGFFFHESCWQLLVSVCHPDTTDLRTLWRLLRSFPNTPTIFWGHNYGGMYSWELEPSESHPSWGNSLESYEYYESYDDDSIILRKFVYHKDPFRIPWLQELIGRSTKPRKLREPTGFQSPTFSIDKKSNATDPFQYLTSELIDMILTQIQSTDILAASLASRALASAPRTQSFWRSRFFRGHEYEHVFEATQPLAPHLYRDWRSLYFSLKAATKAQDPTGSALDNRSRIWNLMKPTSWYLRHCRGATPSGQPLTTAWDLDDTDADIERDGSWNYLHGQRTLELLSAMTGGCRTLYDRTITINSSRVNGISVAFVPNFCPSHVVNGKDYGAKSLVSGLTFHCDDGVVQLGYSHGDFSQFIDLRGKPDSSPRILGFEGALSGLGIVGLAVLTDSEHATSAWAGTKGVYKTTQIVSASEDESKQIIGQFDGFRMVNLAIAGEQQEFDLESDFEDDEHPTWTPPS